MGDKIKAIIIVKEQYEKTVEFKTNEEFHAYSEGLTTGANLYAGDCGLYCVEDLVENGGDIDETDARYNIIKSKLNS